MAFLGNLQYNNFFRLINLNISLLNILKQENILKMFFLLLYFPSFMFNLV